MPTSHGKAAVFYANGYDLTSFVTKVEAKATVDTAEVTTLGATGKAYVAGVEDATMSVEAIFTGASGELVDVLTQMLGIPNGQAVFLPQGDTLGARCVAINGFVTDFTPTSDIGDATKVSASLQSSSGYEAGISVSPKASITTSGNGTGVDEVVTTTNGASAHFFAFTTTGTSVHFQPIFETSSDNSSYATAIDIGDQVLTAGTVYHLRGTVAAGSTLNHWVRLRRVVSGSSPNVTCAAFWCRQ